MSARDDVIDHLAENIESGRARLLAVRAGAKQAKFPAGDHDGQALWENIVEQLEDVHGNAAFERLFDVLVKDYPRTVEEARTMLEKPADAGLESTAPKKVSNRPRRIRVYDGDDEVWWISRAGDVALDVWVSAKARQETPPRLVVTGEGSSEVKIDEPELDQKKEWWVFGISLTPGGLQRRDLQFRVADTPKSKQSLTIVNPWSWYPAGAALLVASLICAAVYFATFPRIPGASWSAIIGALPTLPIVAGVLSLAPPLAKLRVLFLYPARLLLGAIALLALALLPGMFLVAVENGTTTSIRLGKTIDQDEWVVVTPSRLDREGTDLCRTQAARAPGLDAFLPRSVVTGESAKWPVLGNGFKNATITASGGLVRDSEIVFPCDHDPSSVPTADVKHLNRVIHVPYPWTVSVVEGSSDQKLKLDPPTEKKGTSDTLAETEVLSADGGSLRCAGSGSIVMESLFSGLAIRTIAVESTNKISTSKWTGATSAWRCRFDAEKTVVDIALLESNNKLDLQLPADLGVTTLKLAGTSAAIRVENRFVHVRPATYPTELEGKDVPFDDGDLHLASKLAILSLAKQGPNDKSFKQASRNYKLTVSSDGSLKIERDEMPSGPCTYYAADKITEHRKPPAGMTCTKYEDGSENKDAKSIVNAQREKRYSCTDVYICHN